MSYTHPLELGIERYGIKKIARALDVTPRTLDIARQNNALEQLCYQLGVLLHSFEDIKTAIKNNRKFDGRNYPTKLRKNKLGKQWDVTKPHYDTQTNLWRWLTDDGEVDYNDLRNYTGFTKGDYEMPHIEWCAACGFILEMPDEEPIPCPYPKSSKKWKGN